MTNLKVGGLINAWNAGTESLNVSKTTQANPSSIRHSLPPQGLYTTWSSSGSSSVLTNTIIITSSTKTDNESDQFLEGILDENEINGPEWDAVISSPLKGKKHVNNVVSLYYQVFLCFKNFSES